MLIFSRRVGETVVIGRTVTIHVIGLKGNQVRLGIDAPADVEVHRGEIFERIRFEESTPDSGVDPDSGAPVDVLT